MSASVVSSTYFGTALIALIIANLLCTRSVWRLDYPLARKMMSTLAIWVVPMLGALGYAVIRWRANARDANSVAGEFVTGLPPEVIRQAGGQVFEFEKNLTRREGHPIFESDDFNDWLDSLPTDAARDEAFERAQRAWLLHLRAAAFPAANLLKAQAAWILSSLPLQQAQSIAALVSLTRQRITNHLTDCAHFHANTKVIVLIFDDEESYYRYSGAYLPEEGNFAFSGGVFIARGFAHFATRRDQLLGITALVTHEMTHMAVDHLQLPLWINEGIAVNTERHFAGVTAGGDTPMELDAKHRQFWNAETIQEFWRGDSFARHDDGNALSYDLARILVQHLAQDWAQFVRFLYEIDPRDAGAAAARSVLNVSLGASAAALYGHQDSSSWEPEALPDSR